MGEFITLSSIVSISRGLVTTVRLLNSEYVLEKKNQNLFYICTYMIGRYSTPQMPQRDLRNHDDANFRAYRSSPSLESCYFEKLTVMHPFPGFNLLRVGSTRLKVYHIS